MDLSPCTVIDDLEGHNHNTSNSDAEGISKLQAVIRGRRSRALHTTRARQGALVCPFYASSAAVVDRIIQIAQIGSNDIVYDLGCGDGAIITRVALTTGASAVGYEIDSVLCAVGRRKAKDLGVGNLVRILEADIMCLDLTEATVVCLFLTPNCLDVLSPELRSRCKPGTKIVCYKFPLPVKDGWEPHDVAETEDVINTKNICSRSSIYMYHA